MNDGVSISKGRCRGGVGRAGMIKDKEGKRKGLLVQEKTNESRLDLTRMSGR